MIMNFFYPDAYPKARLKAVIYVGAPGSGKSTLAAALLALPEWVGARHLCADDIRGRLPDPYEAGAQEAVWEEWWRRLDDWSASGLPIVCSDTNTHLKDREMLLELLLARGYEVELVVVHPPLEEVLRRNSSRERVVPEDKVRAYHARVGNQLARGVVGRSNKVVVRRGE